MRKIGVLTSGGDSPGMNAAIRAVTRAAIYNGLQVKGIYRGYKGLVTGEIKEFKSQNVSNIIQLGGTILKTARCKEFTTPEGRQLAYDNMKREGIDALVIIGGDGSLTGARIFAQEFDVPCIGLPGTIDNDLYGTDHCPGFGSAAKFIATSCMEVHQDLRVYDKGRVTIVEIMGRHAGWLAGSAALATYAGAGPDLVYLPEVPFRMEEFWQDVDRIYKRNGSCMVAVSEGVQYADGRFVAESGDRDVFGHTQLGGLGAMLAESVKRQTGAKVRSIELSLLQRCASHVASKTDIDEAYMAGKAAVEAAVSGQTDKMVAFERSTENGIYSCKTKLTSLGDVANVEKLVPREWINTRGNGVEQPFIDYVLPLIQGETAMQKECSLPRFAKLKKVLADPVQG